MKKRLLHIFIALDQLIYVLITLGKGSPYETLSAAAWRLEKENHRSGKIFRPIVDLLFWFDPEHCKTSYEAQVVRASLIVNKQF
jgi:hypothetical protein